MDYHKENTLVAEGYVLGDLTQEESDAFEEHFFGCLRCADEVRDAATIADGIRTSGALVKLENHSVKRVNHAMHWALAASVVIAIGLGYLYLGQRVPTPIGQATHITAEQPIELDSARGAGDIHKMRADQPVALYFVIPPPEHPPAVYACELWDAANAKIETMSVTQAQARNTVKMPLKPQMLHSGQYKVVIRGGDDREIVAEYSFAVEVR
ncbi:MAG: hypothetical protein ACRD3J_10365 [Thermoanaerobaculia bacterium]